MRFENWIGAASLMLAGTLTVSAGVDDGRARVPVLLELFTSEGCSSCPPADKLLETLDRTQPIPGADLVVLSEHVDYWNNLGWRDPFSSAENTARQREYASKFHLDSVYTPQLVVDGKAEVIGSRARDANAAIEHALTVEKSPIVIGEPIQETGRLRVHIEAAPPGSKNAVLYVALADNEAHSQVARGENSGRLLTHVAVVRTLIQVRNVPVATPLTEDVVLPLKTPASATGLRVVAFVQDRVTGQILSVGQRALTGKLTAVQWTLVPESAEASPGATLSLKLHAEIAPGFHLYSLTTPPGGPIRTTVHITPDAIISRSLVSQPQPEQRMDTTFNLPVELFSGPVDFPVKVTLKEGLAAGNQIIKAVVRYQACSDEICLPPTERFAEAAITVRSEAATRQAQSVPQPPKT